jgi:hypothetical protein
VVVEQAPMVCVLTLVVLLYRVMAEVPVQALQALILLRSSRSLKLVLKLGVGGVSSDLRVTGSLAEQAVRQ